MPVSDPAPRTSAGPAGGTAVPRPLVGVLFKLASVFAFSCMGAAIKILSGPDGRDGFPVGQVMFARSFFALIPIFVWLALVGRLHAAFTTANRVGHFKRGLIAALGMYLGFAGLMMLPFSDATAISFATPLFSVVLAVIMLGEVVRLHRWSAVLIGFCGVIVMLWPHLSADALSVSGNDQRARGALLALGGAICAAFAMIEVRRLITTETTAAIVTHLSLMTTVFGMVSVAGGAFDPKWAWLLPDARQAVFLVLAGISGGFGQIFLTESYRHAPASVIAPFDYSAMIFALAWGYVLFGDIPDRLVVTGAVIVSAAGIYVILRERRLGIDRTRQAEASAQRTI